MVKLIALTAYLDQLGGLLRARTWKGTTRRANAADAPRRSTGILAGRLLAKPIQSDAIRSSDNDPIAPGTKSPRNSKILEMI